MWIRSKLFLSGFLVWALLLFAALPGYSLPGDVTLTAEEYRTLTESLRTAESSLTAAKREIKLLNLTLQQQERILTMQSILWPQLKTYSDGQKSALKSEYWTGFLNGSIIGVSIGFTAGNYTGFKIGISLPL